ncbi:hypothetical protein [Streptomyces sp. GSL17-111]|uniref:hypothetical protein n=1 Tax=Streptomyces sp. GSL17-111 TaxID=3121596 RepID=UPI0030F4AC08
MRKQYRTPAMATAAALMAVAGLSACGSESNGLAEKSGKEVSEEAGKALKDVTSFQMQMESEQDGSTFSIDLTMDRDGNCVGKIDQGEQGTAEIVKQGDKVWMKPDQKFWEVQGGANGAAVYELFKGKYLAGTTQDPMLQGMAGSCDLKALQEDINSDDDGTTWSDPKEGEVDGKNVVTIKGTSEEDEEETTMHVAAEGTAYPVQIVNAEGGAETTVSFGKFDEGVPDDVPSEDESFDVSKLEQAAGS